MESRIEQLELKLSFMEDTVQALNDVVTRQDLEIQQLNMQLKHLKDKLQDVKSDTVIPEADETPPPHY